MKTTDSRAVRTKARLDAAFVTLLHRRMYDTLRVSDITKKAAVGRATFYAHYTSKDDLLSSQIRRIVLPMLRVQTIKPFSLDCRAFFEHIRTAPQLYKALMGGRERNGVRVIREELERHIEGALAETSQEFNSIVPKTLAKRYIVSTLLCVAAHMLSTGGMATGDEMQRLFERLVGSGLGA